LQELGNLAAGVVLVVEQNGVKTAGHTMGPLFFGLAFENSQFLSLSGR
jgi:hypothetical protein